jgi:hypothetical protein
MDGEGMPPMPPMRPIPMPPIRMLSMPVPPIPMPPMLGLLFPPPAPGTAQQKTTCAVHKALEALKNVNGHKVIETWIPLWPPSGRSPYTTRSCALRSFQSRIPGSGWQNEEGSELRAKEPQSCKMECKAFRALKLLDGPATLSEKATESSRIRQWRRDRVQVEFK